jgi:hypothetical protein
MEAVALVASGQSLAVDVWTSLVARRIREWDFPLIPLERMGFRHDEDGFLTNDRLIPLPSGAEAQPFLETQSGVVYKLFDLRPNGSLGKKLSYEPNEDGAFELVPCDAVLSDTLDKITTLHDAGAHPSEIAGISHECDYLIVKQPLAQKPSYHQSTLAPEHREEFLKDRARAIENIRGVTCSGGGFRQTTGVIFVHDQPWLVADLHHRNIMRNHEGEPTIIDALIGPVSPAACKAVPELARAVGEARIWAKTGTRPQSNAFDMLDDADL